MSCLNTDKYLFHLQNPLLLGGALAGIGSLIGGGISAISQNNTNKTNLQIARETNRANRQNQEYQNEWNLNMWNRQNEYNDPSVQRQRLEDAGLNPIFYGLDGTGNAGALQSAPFEAQNGFPMQNSGQFIGQSVANAFNAYSDAYLKKAQADNLNADTESKKSQTVGQDLENQLKSATLDSEIQVGNLKLPVTQQLLRNYEADGKKTLKQVEEIEKHIDQMTNDIDIAKKRYTLDEWRLSLDAYFRKQEIALRKYGIDKDFQARMKQVAVAMFEAELHGREVSIKETMLPFQILNADADINLKKAQTAHTAAQTAGHIIDNSYKGALNEATIRKILAEANDKELTALFGSGLIGDAMRTSCTLLIGLDQSLGLGFGFDQVYDDMKDSVK